MPVFSRDYLGVSLVEMGDGVTLTSNVSSICEHIFRLRVVLLEARYISHTHRI